MPDPDIASLSAEIGKDLFGGEPSSDPKVSEGGTGEVVNPLESGANPNSPGGENSILPPDIPLPKAWKKEKEPLWMKLDREAREYITAREADVLKGFEQYSTGHKRWSETVAPFEPILKQYPDLNPVQLIQNLLHNHVAIVQGTPEQKKALVSQLLKSYGVELGSPEPGQADPRLQTLEQKLTEQEKIINGFIQGQQKVALDQSMKTVEAFAKDPKNKHFEKVAPDVLRFLQTGAAADLAQAYELACYANPEVRALLLAETPLGTKKSPNNPLPNVNGSADGTPPKKQIPKDWRETVDEVAKAAFKH